MWFKYGFRYKDEIATLELSSATTTSAMWGRNGWGGGGRSVEHLMQSSTFGLRTVNEKQQELVYGMQIDTVYDNLDEEETVLWNVTTGFLKMLFSHFALHYNRTKSSEVNNLNYNNIIDSDKPYIYLRYNSLPRYTPFGKSIPMLNVDEYMGLFVTPMGSWHSLSVNHSTMAGLETMMQDDGNARWFHELRFFRVLDVREFYRYNYVTLETPYIDVQIIGYDDL